MYLRVQTCLIINWLHLFVVEEQTEEDKRKSYSIEWSELLCLNETPLASIDEADPGTELLALYFDADNAIKYAVAKVLPGGVAKKQRGKIIDVL